MLISFFVLFFAAVNFVADDDRAKFVITFHFRDCDRCLLVRFGSRGGPPAPGFVLWSCI